MQSEDPSIGGVACGDTLSACIVRAGSWMCSTSSASRATAGTVDPPPTLAVVFPAHPEPDRSKS